MKDRIFIDTNLFVYAYLDNTENQSEHKKHLQAKAFLKSFDITDTIIISTQVCNEYYSALLKNKISDPDIQKSLKELVKVTNVRPVLKSTVLSSFEVKNRYRYSYWDSLILASALENNCDKLYSEDLQHSQVIEDRLKIINPFV